MIWRIRNQTGLVVLTGLWSGTTNRAGLVAFKTVLALCCQVLKTAWSRHNSWKLCKNPFAAYFMKQIQKSAKLIRKLVKTPKIEIFHKILGRMICGDVWNSSEKKAKRGGTRLAFPGTKAPCHLSGWTRVCYVMRRTAVNADSVVSSTFQVSF